jgi:hypothetical protein
MNDFLPISRSENNSGLVWIEDLYGPLGMYLMVLSCSSVHQVFLNLEAELQKEEGEKEKLCDELNTLIQQSTALQVHKAKSAMSFCMSLSDFMFAVALEIRRATCTFAADELWNSAVTSHRTRNTTASKCLPNTMYKRFRKDGGRCSKGSTREGNTRECGTRECSTRECSKREGSKREGGSSKSSKIKTYQHQHERRAV